MFTREESNQAYGLAQTPEDLRRLCLSDLFFLLAHVMGRKDMDNDWLYARCREVQANPDGYLDLWAREHYKSTIITVGLSIQEILRNPEVTIGIFSHSRPIAKSFLRQIKREFEGNRALQELFPHICPPTGKSDRTWSEDSGLIVQRRTNPKEATIEAWGLVDGQPIGKHFDILVYDDVVTRESVGTPDQIAKTTEMWALSLNLGAHNGRRRHIGTRYHANDTYAEIMRREAAIPRIHAATMDGNVDGEPVFLSREILAEKRRDMGPYVFGCQMLQDPKSDLVQGFKLEWFRTYSRDKNQEYGTRMNVYILVDAASEKKKDSDYTCMWVVGLGEDGNYHILDCIRDRLNLSERADKLFMLHRKWRPLVVGYEKYGQMADIEHIEYLMDQTGYHFSIVPLGGQMPKNDRIRRLVPVFEAGRVFFPYRLLYVDYEGRSRDLTLDFRDDEYLAFPVSAHDDMLDALSRIVDPELAAVFPRPKEFIGVARSKARAVQQSSIY